MPAGTWIMPVGFVADWTVIATASDSAIASNTDARFMADSPQRLAKCIERCLHLFIRSPSEKRNESFDAKWV
jgi:hypothetical protein